MRDGGPALPHGHAIDDRGRPAAPCAIVNAPRTIVSTLVRSLAPLAVLTVLSAPALAQKAPAKPVAAAKAPSATAQAKPHLAAAAKAAKAKDWGAAAKEFEAAYALDPQPGTLEQLAQAHATAGDHVAAYGDYERLLATDAKKLTKKQRTAAENALATLAKGTATIAVGTNETGADVALDGASVGVSPLAAPLRVEPGKHRLEAKKEGFEPAAKEVEAAGGGSYDVELALAKEVTTGHLVVSAKDGRRGRVVVDGKEVGEAPWEGDLEAGQHEVRIDGEAGASAPRVVEIAKKGREEIALELPAPPPPPSTAKVAAVAPQPEPPPAPSPSSAERDAFEGHRGFYLDFSLFGAFPHRVPSHKCNDPTCSGKDEIPPLGAGAILRPGWSFGMFSAELAVAFLGDMHAEKNTWQGSPTPNAASPRIDASYARDEAFLTMGYGGFAGIGGRITSPGTVRLTFGTAVGAVHRSFTIHRETTGSVNDTFSGSDSYTAPGVMMDWGVMLGATPGVKVKLGMLAWLDLPSRDLATSAEAPHLVDAGGGQKDLPTPALLMTRGTQFYVGPTLGVQFGH